MIVAWTSLGAARKKYDERGNLITAPETTGAGAASSPVNASVPPQPAPTAGQPVSSGNTVAPASSAPEQPAEENEAALQKAPLTKVYLENAQMYQRSNRLDKALEFLRKAQEAGQDSYGREARLQELYLRARRGEFALEGDASDTKALLRLADGYQACSRELPKKPECANEAERLYAYIGELEPGSAEGNLARLRLALLLMDQGRLEAALPHLTRAVMNGSEAQGIDRAWYQLGQLYERPWYHRDTHKAAVAYKQVLKYSHSPYLQAAKERIRFIERFGTGISRP